MPKTHLPGVFGIRLTPAEKLVTSLVPRLLALRVWVNCQGECSFFICDHGLTPRKTLGFLQIFFKLITQLLQGCITAMHTFWMAGKSRSSRLLREDQCTSKVCSVIQTAATVQFCLSSVHYVCYRLCYRVITVSFDYNFFRLQFSPWTTVMLSIYYCH